MFDAPHGAVCAALLPAVMDVNLRALSARAKGSPVIDRFREVAAILVGRGTGLCNRFFAARPRHEVRRAP